MDLLSDEQLVANYLKGDAESMETLIGRYLKLIYNFIIRSVGNKEEAEDLTQAVFLKVWQKINKFDTDKKFKIWLYAIARNTIIDNWRKKKHAYNPSFSGEDGELDFFDTVPDDRPSALELIKQEELKNMIAQRLLALPPDDRLLLNLYYGQQMTFREIGEILKQPIDTVKSRHRRALMKLRKIIDKDFIG